MRKEWPNQRVLSNGGRRPKPIAPCGHGIYVERARS